MSGAPKGRAMKQPRGRRLRSGETFIKVSPEEFAKMSPREQDECFVSVAALDGLIAVAWLIHTGRLPNVFRDERMLEGKSFVGFARESVTPREWKAALATIRQQTPEQRKAYVRPVTGDYDA